MTGGKLTLAALVAIGLLVGSVSAAAQTQITLGGSTQNVTFQGKGPGTSTLAVTLGSCTKKGSCTISGSASGTGSLTSGPAPYVFTSTLGSITMSLVNAAAGLWSVSQSSPIGFAYGAKGSLLTGTLSLVDLSQTPNTKTGVFNTIGDANLTVTGGSLASIFTSAGGILDVTIRFACKVNLENLLGTSNHNSGKVSSGEILPTPEPSSIFLLGSGLLAAGTMLRFRGRNKRSTQNQNHV